MLDGQEEALLERGLEGGLINARVESSGRPGSVDYEQAHYHQAVTREPGVEDDHIEGPGRI